MEKITINALNLYWIEERINTYNKKAKKLNMKEIELIKENQRIEEVQVSKYEKKILELVDISFEAEVISFNKGKIIAKITHIPDDENVFKIYNYEAVEKLGIEKIKTLPCNCDHCNSKRRRKVTYLIKLNDEEKIIQVGRTCMKEYTSVYNINSVLNMYDLLEDLEEQICREPFGAEREEYFFNTIDILLLVKEEVEKNGYISGRKAMENNRLVPTSKVILHDIYNEHAIEELQSKKEYDKNISKEIEDIEEKINYILNYDYAKYIINVKYSHYTEEERKAEFRSSFNFKLFEAVGNKYCKPDVVPVLSAFFISYNLLVENKEKIDLKEKNALESKYYGEVKEKIEIDVELTNCKSFVSYYGYNNTNYIYTFKKDNYTFVWITSKCLDIEVGEKIKLKGTIKEHNEFNDIKQTVLTRCKIA